MGGSKKLRLSQLEKRQEKEGKKEKAERAKIEKKIGEVMREDDEKILEKLKGVKVLTPYVVFSQTGLKMGEAKRFLKRLEERSLVKQVNDNSRIPIYKFTQEAA
jgi:ribosomal protein S25